MAFQVKVDYRKAQKKLADANRKAIKLGNDSVKTLTELGMRYAKARAPFDTGKTARAITTQKVDGGKSSIIKSPTPQQYANYTGRGYPRNRKFNLVTWMHTSARAASHIKSGDRRYMYSTTKHLNQIKKGIAKTQKDKIFIK